MVDAVNIVNCQKMHGITYSMRTVIRGEKNRMVGDFELLIQKLFGAIQSSEFPMFEWL